MKRNADVVRRACQAGTAVHLVHLRLGTRAAREVSVAADWGKGSRTGGEVVVGNGIRVMAMIGSAISACRVRVTGS